MQIIVGETFWSISDYIPNGNFFRSISNIRRFEGLCYLVLYLACFSGSYRKVSCGHHGATDSELCWIDEVIQDDVIKWKDFPATGSLCGEFTGHWWLSLTKTSDAKLWVFSLTCSWINGWVNSREAGDLRRHRAHCDVIVISKQCEILTRLRHIAAKLANQEQIIHRTQILARGSLNIYQVGSI